MHLKSARLIPRCGRTVADGGDPLTRRRTSVDFYLSRVGLRSARVELALFYLSQVDLRRCFVLRL
jgi:hypothetical protein